jgi:hypothetical protein
MITKFQIFENEEGPRYIDCANYIISFVGLNKENGFMRYSCDTKVNRTVSGKFADVIKFNFEFEDNDGLYLLKDFLNELKIQFYTKTYLSSSMGAGFIYNIIFDIDRDSVKKYADLYKITSNYNL